VARATAAVWKDMIDRFKSVGYLGRSGPHWPGFFEIQEEIGIFGKIAVHRAVMRIYKTSSDGGEQSC
jgi:hypothetical protein